MATRPHAGAIVLTALSACALSGWLAQAQAPSSLGAVLRFAISSTLFLEVNPNDALSASLIWTRGVVRQSGRWSDASATYFTNSDEAVAKINDGAIDVVALSSLEYLSIEGKLKADPAVLFDIGDRPTSEFVLLVRPEVKSLADLRGKRLAIYDPAGQWSLARLWASVLFGEAGLPDWQTASPPAKMLAKKSQAAMAVFFGQADVAVEDRYAFETAVTLNPQLGKALTVLATSPPLLTGLVCIGRSMDANGRRMIVDVTTTLHERPEYRQTFLLLRVTRLAPWLPRLLDSTRDLVARRAALKAAKGPW